jgi:hypothetical protein
MIPQKFQEWLGASCPGFWTSELEPDEVPLQTRVEALFKQSIKSRWDFLDEELGRTIKQLDLS